ncbi:MAG TPA: hypothetical protein VNT55_07705, partial [Baekduia sp.]|nr:hypothetical protein [Baekduia sp.]
MIIDEETKDVSTTPTTSGRAPGPGAPGDAAGPPPPIRKIVVDAPPTVAPAAPAPAGGVNAAT